MQVHDTPVRLDSEDFAVTVNVGSGGAGVYYGVSSDPVVLAASGTLVAAGGSFVLTTPVWVVSATHGQTADLQLISSTEPSADTTVVTDVRVTSQPVMPESYGARGDGTEHTLGNLYSNLGAAQAAYGGALAPYINSANWTLASIDYLALRAAFAAAQAGGAAGAANNGVLELMPNRLYVMGGGSGVVNSQSLKLNPNSDFTKRTVVRCNGAVVRLSDNVRTLFRFNRSADYQTFQGLDLFDVAVDCNFISGSDAVLLGTLRGGSHTSDGQRANFRYLNIHNPRGFNIPTGDCATSRTATSAAGTAAAGQFFRQFISIASQHVHTNEGDGNWNPNGGAQTVLEHIRVINPQIDGGDYGIALIGVFGTANASATISAIDGTRTVISFTGKGSGSFLANEWVNLGAGPVWERDHIASVVDNGDGTGTVTLASACSTQLAAAVTAGASLPIVMGLQTNVWLDDVTVEGGYHDTLVTPNPAAGTTGGNNIQLGGNAFGRRAVVRGYRGLNCHDDAFECDSILDLTLEDCSVTDPQNVAYLPRNFCVPQNEDNSTSFVQQTADILNCRVRVRNYNPTTSGRATGFVPGYDGVAPGPAYGTLNLKGFRYYNRTSNLRIPGEAIDSYGGATAFNRLIVDDLEAWHGVGNDATPAATIGLIHILNKISSYVELSNIRTVLAGTGTATVTAAQHIFVSPYTINGTTAVTMQLVTKGDLRGYTGLASITTGATQHIRVGDGLAGTTASNLHADLDATMAWLPNGSGDTQPKTLVIGASARMTSSSRINFGAIDNIQRSGGVAVHFLDGSTPGAPNRRVRGRRGNKIGGQISNVLGASIVGVDPASYVPAAGNGSSAPAAGGPSYTWINDTNFECLVFVSGATTATSVDYSPDAGATFTSGNIWTSAGAAIPSLVIPVRPGGAVKLTYSAGTPTITIAPLVS